MREISKTPDKKEAVFESNNGKRYKSKVEKVTDKLNDSSGDIIAIKIRSEHVDIHGNPNKLKDGSNLEHGKVFIVNKSGLENGDYTLEEKMDEFHQELAEELADRDTIMNAFDLWNNLGA